MRFKAVVQAKSITLEHMNLPEEELVRFLLTQIGFKKWQYDFLKRAIVLKLPANLLKTVTGFLSVFAEEGELAILETPGVDRAKFRVTKLKDYGGKEYVERAKSSPDLDALAEDFNSKYKKVESAKTIRKAVFGKTQRPGWMLMMIIIRYYNHLYNAFGYSHYDALCEAFDIGIPMFEKLVNAYYDLYQLSEIEHLLQNASFSVSAPAAAGAAPAPVVAGSASVIKI